jgi:tetraacyldisaccharide 4'-kinase
MPDNKHQSPHHLPGHSRANSRQSKLHRFFLALWYSHTSPIIIVAWLLLPLSYLFRLLATLRRRHLQSQIQSLPVPVVVVGNLTVGGAGKTPVVIALAKAMSEQNIKVGVISRGYRSQGVEHSTEKSTSESNKVSPLLVTAATPVSQSGDEARLILQETQCPVVISQNRLEAAQYLLQQDPEIQLIISDDGLQHYALPRTMEVVVVDGERGLGNGFCLPAGPLREPIGRLKTTDWVLVNGETYSSSTVEDPLLLALGLSQTASVCLKPKSWQQVAGPKHYPLQPLPWETGRELLAVAAIGNPQRFFTTLNGLDLKPQTLAFDDHHGFTVEDFEDHRQKIILMTAKDAVKCANFAGEQWWALNVALELPHALIADVGELVSSHTHSD